MENKRSDLEQFLKRLEKCGDLGLAAQRAGVSDEQLKRWLFKDSPSDIRRKLATRVPNDYTSVFKDSDDSDASDKIALARYKGQLRKNLRAPLMTRENFVKALRHCQLQTKSTRDKAIVNLLVKNPGISNEDGRRKLKITLAAYKMRKKRLLE